MGNKNATGRVVSVQGLVIDVKFQSADDVPNIYSVINTRTVNDEEVVMEVAEHLPGERAAGFVDDLANHGYAIMFSAAPPGQGIQITDSSGHLRPLEEIEGQMIKLAIEKYDGHMSEVARRLGIGRSTLYRKVRDLGLEPQGEE